MTANIFDIQRFCIHDGPGVRTTVFFKGCNLRCLWCHNPESQSALPQLMFYENKCVGCGECRKVCPRAFTVECVSEGRCISACSHGAREISGKTVPVNEIIDILLRDREFYRNSGGGVTLSGGEPLLQADAVSEILSACRREGVQVAVETAGNVPFSVFEKIIPFTGLFLFDIKGIDPGLHKRNTGVSNELILENARHLSGFKVDILFRMPYVPGFNDSEVRDVAAFAAELGRPLELMAYHNTGAGKYKALGRRYFTEDVVPPDAEFMKTLAESVNAKYDRTGI